MYSSLSELINDQAFLKLDLFNLGAFHLKLESLNPAGSVKLKTAVGLVNELQARGAIKPDTILIESSSGNLGVALSMISAERGIPFTCVVDPNCSPHNLKIMRALGAQIVVVNKQDTNGGFLGSRIGYIRELVRRDPRYVWLNQYENPGNPKVHAERTALSISRCFPKLDYLFVGAGTTGTLMGCVQYFAKHRPDTRIVAVDSLGSVTFGLPPGKRYLPGLGASQHPPIFSREHIYGLEVVPERRSVAMCRYLAQRHGLLVGGSTGTVVVGVQNWLPCFMPDDVIVAIAPDSGERYLDTIYDDGWTSELFGPTPLSGDIYHNAEADKHTILLESLTHEA